MSGKHDGSIQKDSGDLTARNAVMNGSQEGGRNNRNAVVVYQTISYDADDEKSSYSLRRARAIQVLQQQEQRRKNGKKKKVTNSSKENVTNPSRS